MDTAPVYFFTRLNINKKKNIYIYIHGWMARQTGKGNFVFQYSLIEQWCSELGLWNKIFLPDFKRIFLHRRFNEFSEEFSGFSDFVIEDFVMLKLWIRTLSFCTSYSDLRVVYEFSFFPSFPWQIMVFSRVTLVSEFPHSR